MIPDLWAFENQVRHAGYTCVAGIDEAGRGPLAGPVVSAAVILPDAESVHHPDLAGVTDSKRLSPGRRNHLYEQIYKTARAIGIGIVDVAEIDRDNILEASRRAMKIAVAHLFPRPDCLLIDGIFGIDADIVQHPLKKGDALSISIAAASIVAKVTRDRMMDQMDLLFPEFGFGQHKGYPTCRHRQAISAYGCSPIHRKTFRGVREYL
ncbi:ribonuclease HII [Desulfosarcina sp. OttesenSCG-928-A07]|nr:ribonuclease HII [Desulfosarcina sp. OttesenSCG-928-G17]MDL2329355.1 ribonuclease HII [Desulfosarcina sp. OttesenSCG-928-A07]